MTGGGKNKNKRKINHFYFYFILLKVRVGSPVKHFIKNKRPINKLHELMQQLEKRSELTRLSEASAAIFAQEMYNMHQCTPPPFSTK